MDTTGTNANETNYSTVAGRRSCAWRPQKTHRLAPVELLVRRAAIEALDPGVVGRSVGSAQVELGLRLTPGCP